MPLFTGRTTARRFRAIGPTTSVFDGEFLERLAARAAGRSRFAAADGIEVGWTAGKSILDLDFDLAKNIMYRHFLDMRLGNRWTATCERIQSWIARQERKAA